MRLINWNIERRGPHTWQAASLLSEIESLEPNLVCLTEAHEYSCEILKGHVISEIGYDAARKADTERLVLLWSREPWKRLAIPEEIERAGGACFGETNIDGKSVRVLGLCIPYHMSRFNLSAEEKTRPWEDHLKFLDVIEPWLTAIPDQLPLIVVGDFNQRIPRVWAPHRVYQRLMEVFAGFEFVTAQLQSPHDGKTIDHVATAGPIKCRGVEARSRFELDGRPRSDHFGVVADFALVQR